MRKRCGGGGRAHLELLGDRLLVVGRRLVVDLRQLRFALLLLFAARHEQAEHHALAHGQHLRHAGRGVGGEQVAERGVAADALVHLDLWLVLGVQHRLLHRVWVQQAVERQQLG